MPDLWGQFETTANGTFEQPYLSVPLATGVFSKVNTINKDTHFSGGISTNNNPHYRPTFKASVYNDTYGKSDTVTPLSQKSVFLIKY